MFPSYIHTSNNQILCAPFSRTLKCQYLEATTEQQFLSARSLINWVRQNSFLLQHAEMDLKIKNIIFSQFYYLNLTISLINLTL